jgi:hypothetical protein
VVVAVAVEGHRALGPLPGYGLCGGMSYSAQVQRTTAVLAADLVLVFTGQDGRDAWVGSQSLDAGTTVERGSTLTMLLRTRPANRSEASAVASEVRPVLGFQLTRTRGWHLSGRATCGLTAVGYPQQHEPSLTARIRGPNISSP